MTAADIILLTGGLTTAKVLSRGIPDVLVDPIPARKIENEFLLNWEWLLK